jgi:hypothetical protein
MNNKIALVIFAIFVGCALSASSGNHHHTPAPTHRPTPAPPAHATPAPPAHSTPAPPAHSTPAPPAHSTPAPPAHSPTHAATTGSSGTGGNLCALTATTSEPIKILVPLYVYPGSDWDTVANAAKDGVKMIAIINPNSGPDPSGPDSSYTTYMNKLTAAGVDMVGYVHTSYGDRASSDVYADIDTYASKYPGLKGIFIDEAAASASEVSYYTGVYNHITSKSGYVNTILNPGTQPDQGYLAVSHSSCHHRFLALFLTPHFFFSPSSSALSFLSFLSFLPLFPLLFVFSCYRSDYI